MPFFRRALKLSTLSAVATVGGFFYYTRNNEVVPLAPSDRIYTSHFHRNLNPSNNPATNDLVVRRVPLSEINPALLEKKGRLTEAFCAGVWSGWGYAFQRAYLARKYQNPQTASDLWSRDQLRAGPYDVGTRITDHFEVVEKTPDHITVRCGDSPRNTGVRASDGLFEISAVVKPDEGVAEFGLKSCLFQGAGKAEQPPMPPHIDWLHKQYAKLWAETALANVRR